jgi:putative hemolysin
VSVEGWIEVIALVLAFLLLVLAGLVDASLIRRQRLTIRELFENGSSGGNAEQGEDQSGELRTASDVALLLAVLVGGAAVAHLTARTLPIAWLLVVLPVAMLIVLTVGRIVPAIIVDRYSLAESPIILRCAVLLSAIMGPFMILVQLARGAMDREPTSVLENGSDESAISREEADAEAVERGEIQHDEHEMISGILSMEEAYAREIMVPRPDIVAVAWDTALTDVVQVAQEAGHSRIPVYQDSIDRVRGIIYAKDLLRFVDDDIHAVELDQLMRPAMFVPESKRVDDLLRDLQRSRVHMAIVVDEYGGTAGLVTIEDVIEEIVGEIQDEYDREVPLYEFGPEGEVTVDGRMSVDELGELIGLPLPETESETVGGLVARELGHIPEPGETVKIGPVMIRVESVERRRVRVVNVTLSGESVTVDSSTPVQVS